MHVRIWQNRNEKRMSLRMLAKKTGISKSTINNIENGKTDVTIIQLEKIAKALNVKITELFESEYK